MLNSLNTKRTLESNGKSYTYYSLKALEEKGSVSAYPEPTSNVASK